MYDFPILVTSGQSARPACVFLLTQLTERVLYLQNPLTMHSSQPMIHKTKLNDW